MSEYRELLIGCGSRRIKHISIGSETTEWKNLTTLDYNPDHNPDIVWNLLEIEWPFYDNTFDEIHAYEVMEHLGQQGDYKAFFAQFSEIWRILKPEGHFMATCPSRHSEWAWGDPSHSRIIQPESLIFLDQESYKNGVGTSAMSDFRDIYKADLKTMYCNDDKKVHSFVLKAIKPSRINHGDKT